MVALLRAHLISSLSLNYLRVKGKRGKAILAILFMVLAFSPTVLGWTYGLSRAYSYLSDRGLEVQWALLAGTYTLTQLVVLLAGVPIVFSTLLQAKDLSILLPLPYRPAQILIAKLSVTYVLEMIAASVFFLPSLLLYLKHTNSTLAGLLNGVLCMLLLPVIPLAESTLLCLVVNSIPGLRKNKWFAYTVMMATGVGASMLLSTTMASTTAAAVDPAAIRVQELTRMGRFLPGSSFALQALVASGWAGLASQALNVLICGGYLVAVFYVGQWLYLGPLLRGDDTGTRSRRASRRSEAEGARNRRFAQQPFVLSYVRKELACTLKDPPVGLNALGGYLVIPIMLVTSLVGARHQQGRSDLFSHVLAGMRGNELSPYIPITVVGIALFIATLGSASSLFPASYSKDGKRLWIEKALPISPLTVFWGKLLAGLLLTCCLNLVVIVGLTFLLPLRPAEVLYAWLLSCVVMGWNGAAGLSIDCRRPKLVWQDTVHAVKQNVNVLLGVAITFLGAGLNALLLYQCMQHQLGNVVLYAAPMALNLLLLALTLLIGRRAALGLERVEV